VDTARLPLLLGELRLPAISRFWPEIATVARSLGCVMPPSQSTVLTALGPALLAAVVVE
jgi:hypothetical protein